MQTFNTIFQQNTERRRYRFFGTGLIKWLWHKIFFEINPQSLLNYFRSVRSYPFEGEERYRTLVMDIRASEISHKTVLLPPNTRDCNNVTLLTRDEVCSEIETKWRYNLRNKNRLKEWLRLHED